MTDTHRAIDAVWKLESAKIIAGLARMVHDVGLAEEMAQDALVAALEQWPVSGVPDNPGAWLTAIAKRRAIDHLRRNERLERSHEQLAHGLEQQSGEDPGDAAQDDLLRLMFISCHPVLPAEERTALTLRLLGGLSAEETARAFLVSEPVITQRVARAKRTLADRRIPFELPPGAELDDRLASVLEVIYLIFNEGYAATSGDDLMRPALSLDALRLGRILAELAPRSAEVHGLVALMEIQASRADARTNAAGEPVQLHEQNRGRWDQLLIRRGFAAMLRARDLGGPPGPYVLQAAIAVSHAQARTAEETDWAQIAALYGALARLLPTPIVQLNRAVAVGFAHGPEAGLDLVDSLVSDSALKNYPLLPGVRGDLLSRLGRHDEARIEFERAAFLTKNAAERAFLTRRADASGLPRASGVTLADAARAFLDRDDMSPDTRRSYAQTLTRLRAGLGDRTPLSEITAARVAQIFATAWPAVAAKTWNRHRSAVRSFSEWSSAADLAADLERRPETRPRTSPIAPAQLAELWADPGPSLRERTLWRLLHESAAPVTTVLSLNIEDLDLHDRRARTAQVSWRSATADLLTALIGPRTHGPLFSTHRAPRHMSYERAEYLFKQATRGLDPAGNGFTLHQLKPANR